MVFKIHLIVSWDVGLNLLIPNHELTNRSVHLWSVVNTYCAIQNVLSLFSTGWDFLRWKEIKIICNIAQTNTDIKLWIFCNKSDDWSVYSFTKHYWSSDKCTRNASSGLYPPAVHNGGNKPRLGGHFLDLVSEKRLKLRRQLRCQESL